MGNILSAIADDEDEWDDFRFRAGLRFAGSAASNWELYSKEADLARQGFREFGFTGTFLIEYVQLQLHLDELLIKFNEDKKEYLEYLRLHKIYGNTK